MEPTGSNAMLWVFAAVAAFAGIGQLIAMIGAMVMFFRSRGASEQSLQSRVAILEMEQTRQSAEDEKLRARIQDTSAQIQALLLLQTKTEGKVENQESRVKEIETLARRIERQVLSNRRDDDRDPMTRTPQ